MTGCFASRALADRTQPWLPAPAAPEDEYAGEEYADYDAEDRKQPSVPAEIPDDEPEDDVLEQRQEVLYGGDER
jgi:hypothetical protein